MQRHQVFFYRNSRPTCAYMLQLTLFEVAFYFGKSCRTVLQHMKRQRHQKCHRRRLHWNRSSNIFKHLEMISICFLGREKSWLQIASSRVCRGVRKSWGSTITEGGWLNLWVRSFIHLSSFGRVLSTRPRLSRLSPAPRRKPRKQLPKKQKRRLSRLGLYWQHFDVWFVSVGGTCLKEWMQFSWNLQ